MGVHTHYFFFFMDPISAGLMVMGVGNLLGGLFGASSTASTNSANIRMNRENINAQREENVLNRRWNEQMIDKQNEYNTPVNQVARLRAAGINPYVAGLDGSGGQMSAPSYSTGLNTQQPNLQPSPLGEYIAQGSSQVGNMLFNSQLQRAQTDGIILDNDLKASSMGANIAKSYAEAGEKAAARRISEKNAEIAEFSFNDFVAKNHAERQQAEQNYLKSIEETYALELENKARQLNLDWLPREKTANLLEIYSRVRLNGASTKQALSAAFAQSNLGKLYQSNKKQVDALLPYMEKNYQQQINLGINQNKLKSKEVAKYDDLTDSQINLNDASAADKYGSIGARVYDTVNEAMDKGKGKPKARGTRTNRNYSRSRFRRR